jgi:hypothetical protein
MATETLNKVAWMEVPSPIDKGARHDEAVIRELHEELANVLNRLEELDEDPQPPGYSGLPRIDTASGCVEFNGEHWVATCAE